MTPSRRRALQVFATAAFGEVRVWHITSGRELLRIRVPNLAPACLAFTHDGAALLSGWDDGAVRAFGPQTGRELYTVAAHHKAVTAVAGCMDSCRFLSGGEDGMVRLWEVRAPLASTSGRALRWQRSVPLIMRGSACTLISLGPGGCRLAAAAT